MCTSIVINRKKTIVGFNLDILNIVKNEMIYSIPGVTFMSALSK